jgi:diguanylate cyclase (GGDEF)-like protein/PAS domain S-box-containing protein
VGAHKTTVTIFDDTGATNYVSLSGVDHENRQYPREFIGLSKFMTAHRADQKIERETPLTETAESAEAKLHTLNELLGSLDECPRSMDSPEIGRQNQLVQVRLGVASSLFTALRIRHAPTSEHCLRVSLGCSAWAAHMEMSEEDRDKIEVAALLHDIGKIGVPDSILRSPRPLTATEAEIMQQTCLFGRHILSSCSADRAVLHIIENIPAWYNGGRKGFNVMGDMIPLGARMIAIVDAFDSMTTDHVYRKALSHERAIGELFENASTQFDPELVNQFAELQSSNRINENPRIVRRWLQDLKAQYSNRFWELKTPVEGTIAEPRTESLFHSQLLESMHDGVIFVDNDACIVRWNRGAERLTGLSGQAVLQHEWLPELVHLRDADDRTIKPDDCPVRYAIRSGTQSMQRLFIRGRRSEKLPVDLHVVPVLSSSGARCGATVLVRDATFEANLEERVQTLHKKATLDPLTGVANRAEFDGCLASSVEDHLAMRRPCSLVICDLDHFKSINDTYGHQAGDEALVSFASLLQRFSRREDLVARYGGEEFVIVCRDCDCSSAMQLAESIREELARTPLSELKGRCITASFGVTELQPGDTPDSMLRRADRALMQAKDTGRNRVVQLGTGMDEPKQAESQNSGWWSNLMGIGTRETIECYLLTRVPINVTVQKLRGFVADHNAQIMTLTEKQLTIKVESLHGSGRRRRSDRPLGLTMQLDFVSDEDLQSEVDDESKELLLRVITGGTLIRLRTQSQRRRDRRSDGDDSARGAIRSLKAYLMADIHESLEELYDDLLQTRDRVPRV